MSDALTRFIDRLHDAFHEGDARSADKAEEARNVACLQNLFRALLGPDPEGFSAGLAEDVVMEIVGPATIPLVGCWRGRPAVLEAVARNFGLVAEQEPEVLSVVAQGDLVVVVGRERGMYRPTGKRYELHMVQTHTFRAGQLVRFHQVFDSAGFLDAMRPDAG
jgi:ketosteroid isomerase-like protein